MDNTPKTPPCPPLDDALVAYLRAVFRTKLMPAREEPTMWEVGRQAGALSVLELLEARLREQEQDKLNVHQSPQDPR